MVSDAPTCVDLLKFFLVPVNVQSLKEKEGTEAMLYT